MVRSLGFGSIKNNSKDTYLKFEFSTPTLKKLSLLFIITCWPIMQKVHCYFYNILKKINIKKLQLIVSIKFQKEAHAQHTFPLQYLFTIGYLNIYRFEGGPPIFKENSTSFLLLYISRFINNNGTITHNCKLFQTVFKLIIK